jgi:hypothetical protein
MWETFLDSHGMRTGYHSWKDIVFSFCVHIIAAFIGFYMNYKTFIVFLNCLSFSPFSHSSYEFIICFMLLNAGQ